MHRFFIRTTKSLIRLRKYARWFESSLCAHVRRYCAHVQADLSLQWMRMSEGIARMRRLIWVFVGAHVKRYVFERCCSNFSVTYEMSQRMTKPTIMRPAKTQISLRIRAVWSESSLIAYAFYSLRASQSGINENCHTGWLCRLIRVLAGYIGLILGFVWVKLYLRTCTSSEDSGQSITVVAKNLNITKTYLYNFDPLKPHFYIVKLGFTGIYIIFLIFAQNIDCEYSLEPLVETVLTSTYNLCFEQKHEKYQNFLSEDFHFLVMKFSVCFFFFFLGGGGGGRGVYGPFKNISLISSR